jgi:hypothetical protein
LGQEQGLLLVPQFKSRIASPWRSFCANYTIPDVQCKNELSPNSFKAKRFTIMILTV